MEEIFEINGVKYTLIKNEQNKINRQTSSISKIAQMMLIYTNPYMDALYKDIKIRRLPEDINIIKEYELIQNKKSKLSKWERDEVTRLFLKKYKRV